MKVIKPSFIKTIALALALGAATACPSTTAVNKSDANAAANTAPTNAGQPETPASNKAATPETPAKEVEKPSTGALATPTEAYKFAYAARRKKDVAGLKRVMSKDALEFFEIMTEPGKPIDDALLKMTETPQASTDESRNEKITGDRATLEYPDAQGVWKTMDFVKEDGEWKLTFPKPDAPGRKK
ncbi:MAG TPA: hypothetical protein VIL74_05190 [Pyrinomonadaceae bacterium]|jgi:hypothetical protein